MPAMCRSRDEDAATERRLLESRDDRSEKTYRQLLADIIIDGMSRDGCPATRVPSRGRATRFALDIGSTVVKLARLDGRRCDADAALLPARLRGGHRAAGRGDARLSGLGIDARRRSWLCSSANGGLRVGIVCLTKHFSGAALGTRFCWPARTPCSCTISTKPRGARRRVDILLVGGGIDCEEAEPAERRLRAFDPSRYRYGALVYAGNRFLADSFVRRFPGTTVIANPLADTLSEPCRQRLRGRAPRLPGRPGLQGRRQRAAGRSGAAASGRRRKSSAEASSARCSTSPASSSSAPASLLDIGGATTDLHYTVEVVRDDSAVRAGAAASPSRATCSPTSASSRRATA